MSTPRPDKTSDQELTALQTELQNTIDSVGGLLSAYQLQWQACFSLAKKEWILIKQSATMVLILSLVISAVLSTLWLLANIALGSVLFHAGMPLWALSMVLLGLNLLLMFILWQAVRTLLNNLGFSRLLSGLLSSVPASPQSESNNHDS